MLRDKNKVLSDKIMVLGVDGLDPRLTRKYIDEGKMPNFKKLAELGAQRHDLVMLGSQPTVTPRNGLPSPVVLTPAYTVSPSLAVLSPAKSTNTATM